MNLITNLQMMIKLVLLLLLALLPLKRLLAQEAGKKEQKMHIKMIRTADGKTVVLDTTITTATHDELVKALKAAKLDTANLHQLRGLAKAFTLGAEGNAAFRAKLEGLKADTALFNRLGDVRMQVLLGDSLKGEIAKHIEVIRVDGKALTIQGNPRLHMPKDSLRAFLLEKNQQFSALEPAEIQRIVVEQAPGHFKTKRGLKNGGSYIRITKDPETGEDKVYRIETDGKQVEVNPADIGLGIARPGRKGYFLRAQVADITASEKQQLKETGAPVEMKPKEELKVEEINFYPNPSNGRINLNFTLKNKGTTVVRIMDSKGDEVFVETVEKLSGEYSRQIDISPFGPGLYYLQVEQKGHYHTKKLLVQ